MIAPGVIAAKAVGTSVGIGAGSALAYEVTGIPGIIVATLGALAAFATLAGVIFGVKYRAACDSETRARVAAESLADIQTERVAVEQARADDVLHRLDETRHKLEEARETLLEAQKTIARLEALPNLERILELVGATFGRLAEETQQLADRNDQNSERRHNETLAALRDLKGMAA